MELKPQHDLRRRPAIRVTADAGAMALLRVKYLEDLIVDAHRPHALGCLTGVRSCEKCIAEGKLRQVWRELETRLATGATR